MAAAPGGWLSLPLVPSILVLCILMLSFLANPLSADQEADAKLDGSAAAMFLQTLQGGSNGLILGRSAMHARRLASFKRNPSPSPVCCGGHPVPDPPSPRPHRQGSPGN